MNIQSSNSPHHPIKHQHITNHPASHDCTCHFITLDTTGNSLADTFTPHALPEMAIPRAQPFLTRNWLSWPDASRTCPRPNNRKVVSRFRQPGCCRRVPTKIFAQPDQLGIAAFLSQTVVGWKSYKHVLMISDHAWLKRAQTGNHAHLSISSMRMTGLEPKKAN